jgi:hypothetical protein
MSSLSFFLDRRTHKLSTLSLGFILWVVGVLFARIFASVKNWTSRCIPLSVMFVLLLLLGGQLLEWFVEDETPSQP